MQKIQERQIMTNEHIALKDILQSRGMKKLQGNYPLWKFKLTDDEYESLKLDIRSHIGFLKDFGIEAALCYAEWWRRDYRGNIPSKEDVAIGIGLSRAYGEELYMAARIALIQHGYSFLHSLKGTEYFRTLLNQGGLPVNYIKNTDSNMGSFTRFLKGLVRELSIINYDWSNEDNSIIQQFSCISYLGKAFKNENIYDVSMQIAHAIIMDDNALLPYDDTDASLSELTTSLKKEYTRAKKERKARPLSLHWKLRTSADGEGYLYVNLDIVKELSSDSIPELSISTCYTFDVFVAGTLAGKYARKSINRDEEGNITNATYTRISVGVVNDILWKGEPVVEVKIRCDNDDRIFLTVAGCYPPNFEIPQLFQMLDENLYSRSETANAEENIAVFSSEWFHSTSKPIIISGIPLSYVSFEKSVEIINTASGEQCVLTNQFTPYTAEFSGNYIPWVEDSNYKLLDRIPIIRVYDKEKNRVHNCKIRYRSRNNGNTQWRSLNSSCILEPGIVDIKVELPDGNSIIETFYAIGDMAFESQNESIHSTEIRCSCSHLLRPEIQPIDDVDIRNIDKAHWKITRNKNSLICPSVCYFRIYNQGNPVLRVAVAIPFDGILITDTSGNIVPRGKIVSLANLSHFCIVSHGSKNRKVDVSYSSGKIDNPDKLKHLQSRVIDGLVSLSDYNDLILRMFNLYGANSFDRNSSVVLNVSGQEIYVRKFVLDTTIENGAIVVLDDTEYDTTGFEYEGDLYAFPVGDDLPTDDFYCVKLERVENENNTFRLPDSFDHDEIVVFSGPEVKRRIIPKYYNINEKDYDKSERASRSSDINKAWYGMLSQEDVMTGKHWRDVCKAFDICSHYNLPFTTYNGLKAIARSPKLLANFVAAMWLNEYKDVLSMEIDRFEQEMVIGLHWIPAKMWEKSINSILDTVPAPLLPMMTMKLQGLMLLLQDLFNSTVSADISQEFTNYVASGEIRRGTPILISDISNYKMKIRGLSDNNIDLPVIRFQLNGIYYPQQSMLASYRVMIESAMCAAENTCDVKNHLNLFAPEGKEYARIVNFYRKYFKETYSEIFFRTVKLISNK